MMFVFVENLKNIIILKQIIFRQFRENVFGGKSSVFPTLVALFEQYSCYFTLLQFVFKKQIECIIVIFIYSRLLRVFFIEFRIIEWQLFIRGDSSANEFIYKSYKPRLVNF